MINRFILNEVSYFGPGAREVLPKEITRLGLRKAFVVTDKDLIKYGVADKVLSVLKSAGIPYEIFSEIKQKPTVFNVKAARVAVEAVKTLAMRVGIPQHLSELGIEENDLERLSEAAFADVCTPGNPREVSKEIILELYRKAL